jgi:hypothetical protein
MLIKGDFIEKVRRRNEMCGKESRKTQRMDTETDEECVATGGFTPNFAVLKVLLVSGKDPQVGDRGYTE